MVLAKKEFLILFIPVTFCYNLFQKYSDLVIILVQSDELIKAQKVSRRPINNRKQRNMAIDGIERVDCVYSNHSQYQQEY